MPSRLSAACSLVKYGLPACLLLLALGAGCERDIVGLEPDGTAIPPTGSQQAAVRVGSEDTGPKEIILSGTVVSVGDSSFVVRLPEPVLKSEEFKIVWWEVVPGLDMYNSATTVFIGPNTYIQMQDDDLTMPKPGSKVVIAGTWLGNGIAAALISDYQMMEEAVLKSRPAPAQVEGSWRELAPEEMPAWFREMPEIFMPRVPGRQVLGSIAGADLETLEFPGKFGNPAWAWSSGHLGIVIPGFPLLGWTEIQNVAFIMGFGGASYNFPFSFEADTPRPLIVDSTRSVNIMVQPQSPPDGTFSFYLAWGFNFHAEYRMCYLGGLYCHNYVWNLNLGLDQVNATTGSAPMPGETLRISDWACPGVDIEIFSVELCSSMRIHGEYLYSSVAMRDSLYMPLEPGWRYWYNHYGSEGFEGSSHEFPVWPATNPLNVDMRDFLYEPVFEIGYKGQVGLVGFTILETPVGWIFNHSLSFIPADYDSCWSFNWFGTCGQQPKGLTLTLPVVPVVTSLTSPDSIYRYGDIVTLQALVRGANGPGSSPRQVTFYNGDQFLATEPIDAQDVATFQTSTLNPCKHVIRAEFIGYDEQGNTHPTDKNLVLIVTGDAQWTQLEGYWQHQYRGSGRTSFGEDSLQCYLDIVNHMSDVFSEVRDISSIEEAHDVLFLKRNEGSEIEQFDRDLLVAWLNFANGGILLTQLIDVDKDGIGDTPFIYMVMAAESVRRDPTSTKKDIKEQTSILHCAVAQDTP